jgi:hypothetical protein
MTRLKTFFKYKYLRRKIRFRKFTDSKRILDENEKLIKNVLIKITSNPENNILLNQDTVYIQTKNKDYTIVLTKQTIKIANHQLFIESKVDERFREELSNIIYHYLNKFALKMNNEVFSNEAEGLNYMLNQLNQLNQLN